MLKRFMLFVFVIHIVSSAAIGDEVIMIRNCTPPGEAQQTCLYKRDLATGTETFLNSKTLAHTNGSGTFYDPDSGKLYLHTDTTGSLDYKYYVYDYINNTFTERETGDLTRAYPVPKNVNTVATDTNTLTLKDGSGNIIISSGTNTVDIKDGSGNTVIKTTSDGATHIGKNSLVTQEVNGIQELYATNSSGSQIDINIKSGTNLLIDGTNVMTHIANSTALSSALTSLPTTSKGEALYTCGLGMGYSAGSTAFAGGCALELGDLGFADDWSSVWKNASFNLGGSTVVSGKSESSIKMGLTFNFGSKGQQKSTITTSSLETDTKMFSFNQKTERQEEKIYKLESELDDMKKQVASAAKLRGEFNTLKRELASAKREINSYKVLNARLDKLERLLSIQTASLN